jgi:hypothetical protein
MDRRSAWPLALLVVVACVGTKARSDFDPNAKFDTFRSFAWLSDEPMIPDAATAAQGGARGVDPLLERRIRSTIDAYLGAKGYRKVDDRDSADFVVSFSVSAREKIRVSSYPTTTGGWYGRYGGWYSSSGVSARSYTEGTLAIDVFDGKSQLAVWHGWTTRRVTESADRAQLVDEVVAEILAEFPPQR